MNQNFHFSTDVNGVRNVHIVFAFSSCNQTLPIDDTLFMACCFTYVHVQYMWKSVHNCTSADDLPNMPSLFFFLLHAAILNVKFKKKTNSAPCFSIVDFFFIIPHASYHVTQQCHTYVRTIHSQFPPHLLQNIR